jgi:hypothetical protein
LTKPNGTWGLRPASSLAASRVGVIGFCEVPATAAVHTSGGARLLVEFWIGGCV